RPGRLAGVGRGPARRRLMAGRPAARVAARRRCNPEEPSAMSDLKPGDQAPDFTLPTDGGGTLSLKQLRGKPVILYFYPKDDTPGCTTEACGFRDPTPDFAKTGATRIGRSHETTASQTKS